MEKAIIHNVMEQEIGFEKTRIHTFDIVGRTGKVRRHNTRDIVK